MNHIMPTWNENEYSVSIIIPVASFVAFKKAILSKKIYSKGRNIKPDVLRNLDSTVQADTSMIRVFFYCSGEIKSILEPFL